MKSIKFMLACATIVLVTVMGCEKDSIDSEISIEPDQDEFVSQGQNQDENGQGQNQQDDDNQEQNGDGDVGQGQNDGTDDEKDNPEDDGQGQDEDAPANGYINGYEYVDLGLSVKWATHNVGASSPSDFGDYFAWGEIETKSEYTMNNSQTYGVEMGDISGDAKYDVARAKWGSTWRMPTRDELAEMINECSQKWVTQDGNEGYLVTGPSGNSIFLPAEGYWSSRLTGAGDYGYYWSSTPDILDENSPYIYADSIVFICGSFYRMQQSRSNGYSVRPVSE